MDLPGDRTIEVADLRHPAFRTAGATALAGAILLALIVVLLLLSYLLVAGV